jgi:hypothetical protein
MFPIESCIDIKDGHLPWFEATTTDPAAFHVFKFAAQTFINHKLGRVTLPDRETLVHFSKGVQLLRKRLGDESASSTVTTIAIIHSLATHAHIAGYTEALLSHMQGLFRVVGLTGGLNTLAATYLKLCIMVIGRDLSVALHLGCPPLFFSHSLPMPVLPCSTATHAADFSSALQSHVHMGDLDETLSTCWRVLSEFCSAVNTAATTGQKLPQELFYQAMVSTMYPLLQQQEVYETGSFSDIIRLALLAFASRILLQWNDPIFSHHSLSTGYRESLILADVSSFSRELQLWLLTAGAVSVFDATDQIWLRPRMRDIMAECGLRSWVATRETLKSFPWVDIVLDEDGARVFENATSNT